MSSTKSVGKNAIASIFPQLINILTNLILPGLIIGLYGSKINGLISTVKSIVSYINLVGAGIATAVTQALFLPVSQKDSFTVRGMLSAANRCFNKYGTIYLIILFLVAFIYPLSLIGEVKYYIVCFLTLVMGISGASEFFVVGKCRALLYADQKVYICTIVQGISLLISLLIAVLMIKLNFGIIIVELAISLVYVSRAFILQIYVNKHYCEYSNIKGIEPINSAIAKKNDAMVHQLTGLAITGSQSVILTATVGLEAASVYAIYNIVFSGLNNICANINTAIMPFLGRSVASEEKQVLLKKYSFAELAFSILAAIIFSTCAVMILPFISLYTNNSDINYIYESFALLFVFCTAFNVIRLPASSMINVSGHFKETKIRAIIEACLCVGVSAVATLICGINGVVIGTGIALGWRMIDMIIYVNKRLLNNSCIKSIIRVISTILIILVFSLIAWVFPINVHNYMQWIIVAMLVVLSSLIVSSIIFVFIDFNLVKAIFKKHIKKC